MGSPFTDTALAALSKPLIQARGLPNEAFVDPDFLSLENKTVFAKNWVFAGRKSQVPNPGDIAMVEVAGDPLFMVRGQDDAVRVFYNVCPHRGARLVNENKTFTGNFNKAYSANYFELTKALWEVAKRNGFLPGFVSSGGDKKTAIAASPEAAKKLERNDAPNDGSNVPPAQA